MIKYSELPDSGGSYGYEGGPQSSQGTVTGTSAPLNCEPRADGVEVVALRVPRGRNTRRGEAACLGGKQG